MAPAVFARKKSGDIHLCVDYQELNEKTQKDTYPLLTLCHYQTKCRTSWQPPEFSVLWTYSVDIGRCLLIPRTVTRLHFAQGQVFQFRCMLF